LIGKALIQALVLSLVSAKAYAICPYDANCLNNPYGGRDPYAPSLGSAPYAGGSAFGSNPLRAGSGYNPYAPQAPTDDTTRSLAISPNPNSQGTTLGPAPGSLEGVDPDRKN
jgi:hypothetical protein